MGADTHGRKRDWRGRTVVVTAGHDCNRYFVVVGTDQGRLLLADGRRRPVTAPKRKNPRHVRPVGSARLPVEGGPPTDETVRAWIRAMMQNREGRDADGEGGRD